MKLQRGRRRRARTPLIVELDRVQLDEVTPSFSGANVWATLPLIALRVEVEGDVEAHVLDIDDAVARVVRLVAGQREAAGAVALPHCGPGSSVRPRPVLRSSCGSSFPFVEAALTGVGAALGVGCVEEAPEVPLSVRADGQMAPSTLAGQAQYHPWREGRSLAAGDTLSVQLRHSPGLLQLIADGWQLKAGPYFGSITAIISIVTSGPWSSMKT